MNLFWKSQTMGIPMKYFYFILPIAFTAMTLRIIQNNYLRFVKKVDLIDPEAKALESLKKGEDANATNKAAGGR
jgi:TRAP-type C4-dicarboxylate transport system permease small subunit